MTVLCASRDGTSSFAMGWGVGWIKPHEMVSGKTSSFINLFEESLNHMNPGRRNRTLTDLQVPLTSSDRYSHSAQEEEFMFGKGIRHLRISYSTWIRVSALYKQLG